MPETWITDRGYRAEQWTSDELRARERVRTLRIQDERRELRAQARARHATVAALAVRLVAEVVDLHAPSDGSPGMGEHDVTCEGCPDSYDGRASWPCSTFELIERRLLGSELARTDREAVSHECPTGP